MAIAKAGGSFRSNIARVATSSFVSQAILIAATPFLTRLYAPEEFGSLAIFSALHAIFAVILTCKYDLAIILPKDNESAFDLAVLSVALALTLSAVALALFGAAHMVFGITMPNYLLLLPVSVTLAAAYSSLQQWEARRRAYGPYAKAQILGSLGNISVVLLLSTLTGAALGRLVLGFVAGIAFSVIYLPFAIGDRSFLRERFKRAVTLAALVTVARDYRQFPRYVLPLTLLTMLGQNLPPLVLKSMFSLEQVGYYAIAARCLLIPSSILGGAIGEPFRSEYVVKLKAGEDVAQFMRRTLMLIAAIALPAFAILVAVAPEALSFFLGGDYRHSGDLVRYMGIGIFAQFVSAPFQYVFVATGHMRSALVANVAIGILPLGGLALAGPILGLEGALFVAAVITFALSAMLIMMAYRASTAAVRNLPREIRP
jgi:O-antigen/teichoic acid export membrane protein